MVDINYLISELEIKIDMMNESDLKGELSDEELDELDKLKSDLKAMLEAKDEL